MLKHLISVFFFIKASHLSALQKDGIPTSIAFVQTNSNSHFFFNLKW
uniref:Uncharacterized protein n=1 Tax=Physcomitrium patens TaxID=3218 RepID=A0A2K1KIX9_PHYPA|nr:hypothetical protein PHYPA_007404 [Physcomitrium patens]